MFDPKSYDLAVHFLPNATEEVWNALAQDIQDTVERFDEEAELLQQQLAAESYYLEWILTQEETKRWT